MSTTFPNEPCDLAKLDEQNKEKLKLVLADHVWVLDRAQFTIATALQLGLDRTSSGFGKVFCINLLTRLQNELTAVKLLCTAGYSLQAFSIGSVIYELTWAITAVGIDDFKAGQWFSHTQDSMLENALEMTRRGLLNLHGTNPSQDKIKSEYQHYRDLCMGKHFNPKLQQTQGFDLSYDSKLNEVQTFSAGSACTQREVIKSWWLIQECLRLLPNPLHIFAKRHVPTNNQFELTRLIGDLENEIQKLETDAARELANLPRN